MATLPFVGEVNVQLHADLLTALQQCVDSETRFQNEVLPKCVDDIKTAWYERTHTVPEILVSLILIQIISFDCVVT